MMSRRSTLRNYGKLKIYGVIYWGVMTRRQWQMWTKTHRMLLNRIDSWITINQDDLKKRAILFPLACSLLSSSLDPPLFIYLPRVSSNRARDPSMKRAGCQATATVTEQCIRTLRHPLPCWKSITHFCMHYGQRRAPGRLLATSAAAVRASPTSMSFLFLSCPC